MKNQIEIEQLADFAAENLDYSAEPPSRLKGHSLPPNARYLRLSDEYYYAHLSCCVLDAVFSIGAKYASTRQVPIRYCAFRGVKRLRTPGSAFPPPEQQEMLSVLVSLQEAYSYAELAENIFQNRQLTSTRGGILKAEAALRFAQVLTRHGIETFQDLARTPVESYEAEIRQIPGQRSGISLDYFLMLAGSEHLIKADRHVLKFLRRVLKRTPERNDAIELLNGCSEALESKEILASPRELDHAIWNFMRNHPE